MSNPKSKVCPGCGGNGRAGINRDVCSDCRGSGDTSALSALAADHRAQVNAEVERILKERAAKAEKDAIERAARAEAESKLAEEARVKAEAAKAEAGG